MSTEKRKGFLNELLEKTGLTGDGVRDELKEAADRLDELGVERKDADFGAQAKAITASIMEAAGGDLSSLSEDNLANLIENNLAPPAVEKAEDDEEKPDGEDVADDEEDGADEAVKALTDFIGGAVSDMGKVAKATLELTDRFAQYEKERQADRQRLAALEDIVKARSRQASQADETVVKKSRQGAAEIEKEIKEGLNGKKTVLGHEVTD